MLCTGCERYWYTEDSPPCPYCFPGLVRDEVEEIILDFFAFQAAVCTGRPDCTCGRDPEDPVHH